MKVPRGRDGPDVGLAMLSLGAVVLLSHTMRRGAPYEGNLFSLKIGASNGGRQTSMATPWPTTRKDSKVPLDSLEPDWNTKSEPSHVLANLGVHPLRIRFDQCDISPPSQGIAKIDLHRWSRESTGSAVSMPNVCDRRLMAAPISNLPQLPMHKAQTQLRATELYERDESNRRDKHQR